MKKITFAGFITLLYAVFVIIGYKSGNANALFAIISVGITGIMMLASNMKLLNIVLSDKVGLMFVLYLLFSGCVLSFTRSNISNFLLSRYSLFFAIIMYIYLKNEDKSYKVLVKLFLLVWFFTSIRAVYLYSTGAVNARQIASHIYTENAMAGGGYGFGIASAFFAVYLLEMMMWKRIKVNFINIGFIILLCAVVYFTKSTITIIALCIGLVAAIILRAFSVNTIKDLSVRQIVIVFMLIVGMILFFVTKERIGEFILDITSGSTEIVGKRIREIGYFLTDGSDSYSYSNTDMSGRMNRLQDSIQVFMDYPFFGAMMKYGSNFYVLSYIGLGSHGELFDALGMYGLFTGIPYLGMFFLGIKRERDLQKNKIGFGYIIAIFIMMFFNPFLFSQVNFILFFMMPMLTIMYNSESKEDELTPVNIKE